MFDDNLNQEQGFFFFLKQTHTKEKKWTRSYGTQNLEKKWPLPFLKKQSSILPYFLN